jgi:predicted metal-dependent phosphoesterase TrpH
MVNKNPRGSEWRKWDLHVHAPGTRLNDQYVLTDERHELEQFCQIIHESDVSVVAIADYFCLDSYFSVRQKYEEMYPDDGLLLLPNLEVRCRWQ